MKRFFTVLLSGLMFISNTSMIYAEEAASEPNEIILDSYELNPDTLHVQKLGETDQEDSLIEEETVPYRLNDIVRVSIVLDDASTLDAGYSAVNYAENQAAQNYRNQLKAKQDALTRRIEEAIGGTLDVKWNLTLAVNIISANVKYTDIVKIKKISGVKDVFIENQYEAMEDDINTVNTSTYMVGAQQTWNQGYTGAGTRVAIIDTGIDTTHQSFNADAFNYAISQLDKEVDVLDQNEINQLINKSELNGSGKWFSSKIPYGYNYVDGTVEYIDHVHDTEGEHGSHVAGIAAANQYIKNGSTYTKAAESVKAVGMAPDAQLFVMKVFGAKGGANDSDYMAAIEDALLLGCDTVNLSLGSGAPGFTYSNGYQDILNQLTESDSCQLVVTISAGNSSSITDALTTDLYIDDVSMHTGGEPGTFINSLGVASADNIGNTGKPLVFNGSQTVYYTETSSTGAAMSSITGSYSYVYIDAFGETADYKTVNSALSLSGKIVIVNRGELSFYEKGNNAISYSPKALIVANNEAGTINMSLDDYTGTFPMVAITLADAETIKANSTKKTTGSYTYYTGSVQVTNTMQSGSFGNREDTEVSSFSSWGVPGSLLMKPEITAPGGNIYSVFGTNKTSSGTAGGSDQYELMSGTSMAAPHMAGLSAVLMQKLKENNISINGYSLRAVNQSLMMSTATPMINDGQYVSILQQGSGLADVSKAVNATSVIMMDENDGTLTAKTGAAKDGKVKAELGDNPTRTAPYSYSFTIYNLKDTDAEYELDTKLFTQGRYTEDGHVFMSPATTQDLIGDWDVKYQWADLEGETHDVNGDGSTDSDDVQTILDYVVLKAAGKSYTGTFMEAEAEMNGDNKITTDDAYELIKWLKEEHEETEGTVPGGGSRKVTVTITPDNALDEYYPSGAYVEGFTYIKPVSKTKDGAFTDSEHTIPLLGFYGSWTDPSMFDNNSYTDTLYGTETVPYSGHTSNYVTIQYGGAPAKFSGNPYMVEEQFPTERLAINSSSQIDNFHYNLLRSAGTTGFVISRIDEIGGDVTEVLSSSVSANGVTGLWYYANQQTWQNTGTKFYSLRKAPAYFGLNEGDVFRAGFYAVPEYNAMILRDDMTAEDAGYLDAESLKYVVESNQLGKGAFMGYDFTIDNTAPVISDAVLSGNTISISASDNINLAYLSVLSLDGSKVYAEKAPGKDTYTISFDGTDAIANAPGYVAVFAGDYAGNETAKALKVNDNAYEEKTVYVQTDTLTAGNEYLIVNTNSTGSGVALGHSGTAAATNAVTIKAGTSETNNKAYIESGDVADTSIWTVASGYTFKNDNYYLRRSTSSIIGTQSANWSWNSSNHRLSTSGGIMTYYLRYSNGSFSASTSASSVYLYLKTVIRKEVDPYGVDSVTVTPGSLDLYKGNEADLIAKVLPLTADDRTVSWSSSNTSVASVDEHGHVRALSAGSAVITAKANGDSSKTASVNVAVTSINKTLNGIVWDEEGGVYFSNFNASTLPAYNKLHSDSQGKQLASAFMANSSTLYAGTLDTGSAETVLYTVNRNNYSLTEFGTNYVFATDTARASSQYTDYFVYSFAKYLIFGNLTPVEDEEVGTFSGLPYGLLDVSSTSGDGIYVAGVAAKSIGSTSSSFYFLDENGVIWETTMKISSSVSFGTPTKVVDTGIGTSFLYQSLYYDGTYLYWTHYDNNVTELIIINPAIGAVYDAGNFGEGVWPVLGVYVNGSAAPASEGDEIMAETEPLNLTPVAQRADLMNEEVMNRFYSEVSNTSGNTTNALRNYRQTDRETRQVERLIRTAEKVKAETEESEEGVIITLSEDEAVNNGLYKVSYDPAKIRLVSRTVNAEYQAEYIDEEEGAVYIAYADENGFNESEKIGRVIFTNADGMTSIKVDSLESDDEAEVIQVGSDTIIANSATMALEGLLKVNFYVTVPSDMAETTYIRMKLANEDEGFRIKASDAPLDSNGRRFLQCPIATAQLNEEITMIAEDEQGTKLPMYTASGRDVTEGLKYSAMTYINNKVNNESTETDLKELLKATGEYGRYAQKYFNYGTLDQEPEEITDVTADDLFAYKTDGKSGTCDGITLKSATMECNSGTNVHVHFTIDSGKDIEDYEYLVDNELVTPEWNETKKAYRISSKDIPSNALQNMYTFVIRKKGETAGVSITYGVFSFGYSKLSKASTSAELAGMVKAQYKYNLAAIVKFGNPD